MFGSRDRVLFVFANVAYILFTVASFVTIGMRRQFNLQLATQVIADIAFIVLLIAASGGISSGLGLLLLTTLAGAGLISRGQLSLFFAALAGIALMTAGIFLFAVNDALGKWLVATYTVGQVLLIRSLAALAMLAPLKIGRAHV